MRHDSPARLEIILTFAATFFIPIHVSFADFIMFFAWKQWIDSSISFGDIAMASFRFFAVKFSVDFHFAMYKAVDDMIPC